MEEITKDSINVDKVPVDNDQKDEEFERFPQPAAQKEFVLNLMVSGEARIGKTSFLNTFFPTEFNFYFNGTGDSIRKHDEVELTTENGSKLFVRAIDTPGYAYSLDDHQRKISEIESYQRNAMNKFDGTAPIAEDQRIHICFYFISPHYLKEIDIIFMRRLSPLMNIIPLISKADTMTKSEKIEFTSLVEDRLKREGIPIFSLDEKRKVFSVINADEEGGERIYDWGIADFRNINYSDVLTIKKLFQSEFCQIFLDTNKKTNRFMKKNVLIRRFPLSSMNFMKALYVLVLILIVFGMGFHSNGFILSYK
eukprot:TRINITY_DN3648_c0_g1_i6.p1 TRINITY_DN3648_c0_g1~~TRINITY_DN3648_c0_g1_i6.p1  ORF type:complete len:309 (+),score=85.13 TRINITY_DN3648_c0_g1_i6:1185-2111(+)